MDRKYVVFAVIAVVAFALFAYRSSLMSTVNYLPYWIEPGSDGPYRVWFHVASLPPDGNVVFYVFPSANAPAPDANAIFPFFWDFNWGVPTDVWVKSGSVGVSDGAVVIRGGYYTTSSIYTAKSYSLADYVLVFRAKVTVPNDYRAYLGLGYSRSNNYDLAVVWSQGHGPYLGYYTADGWKQVGFASVPDTSVYQTYLVTYDGSSIMAWIGSPVNRAEIDASLRYSSYPVGFYATGTGTVAYVQWVYLVKRLPVSPQVTVTDMGGYYRVVVHNPSDQELNDFAVSVSASTLNVSSVDERLAVLSFVPDVELNMVRVSPDLNVVYLGDVSSLDYNVSLDANGIASVSWRFFDANTGDVFEEGNYLFTTLSVSRPVTTAGEYNSCFELNAVDVLGRTLYREVCDEVNVLVPPSSSTSASASVGVVLPAEAGVEQNEANVSSEVNVSASVQPAAPVVVNVGPSPVAVALVGGVSLLGVYLLFFRR